MKQIIKKTEQKKFVLFSFLILALISNTNVWSKTADENIFKNMSISAVNVTNCNIYTSTSKKLTHEILTKELNKSDIDLLRKKGVDYEAIKSFQQQNTGSDNSAMMAVELNNLLENARRTRNRTLTAAIGLGLSILGSILVSAGTPTYSESGTGYSRTSHGNTSLLGLGLALSVGGSITAVVGVFGGVGTAARTYRSAQHVRELLRK